MKVLAVLVGLLALSAQAEVIATEGASAVTEATAASPADSVDTLGNAHGADTPTHAPTMDATTAAPADTHHMALVPDVPATDPATTMAPEVAPPMAETQASNYEQNTLTLTPEEIIEVPQISTIEADLLTTELRPGHLRTPYLTNTDTEADIHTHSHPHSHINLMGKGETLSHAHAHEHTHEHDHTQEQLDTLQLSPEQTDLSKQIEPTRTTPKNDITYQATPLTKEQKKEMLGDDAFMFQLTHDIDALEHKITQQEKFLSIHFPEFAMMEGPVDGGFSMFSEWTPCTKKCGGKAFRFRHCNTPTPRNGGRPCTGHTMETRTCPNTCYAHSRLVNGPRASTGRLEVLINTQWTSVCHNNFTVLDARIVCRNLGFSATPLVLTNAEFGQSQSKNILTDLQCNGTEKDLLHCPGIKNTININAIDTNEINRINTINGLPLTCSHKSDVSIDCEPHKATIQNTLTKTTPEKTPLKMTALRLRGGVRATMGRLEVRANENMWGTVCDDHFDTKDAIVACRTMGFLQGFEPTLYKQPMSWALSYGPILLDDVRCLGNEINLDMCRHRPLGQHSCHHYEDVSIDCQPATNTPQITAFCPEEFIQHNGFCYLFSEIRLNKDEAAYKCHEIDAHLLEVRDLDQAVFITNTLANHTDETTTLWMGIKETNDAPTTSQTPQISYRFETDNRKPIYTDFRPETAPAHLDSRKCVTLTDEREWVRTDCRQTSRFVCQKYGKMPATEPTSEAGTVRRF